MCGHSSVVERLVANEKVEGSTPFARSIMTDLLNKKCVPCEGGVKPFDISEISNGATPPSQGTHFLFSKSVINWSGQRGSNPRPSRWQRDALPLSYARIYSSIDIRFF